MSKENESIDKIQTTLAGPVLFQRQTGGATTTTYNQWVELNRLVVGAVPPSVSILQSYIYWNIDFATYRESGRFKVNGTIVSSQTFTTCDFCTQTYSQTVSGLKQNDVVSFEGIRFATGWYGGQMSGRDLEIWYTAGISFASTPSGAEIFIDGSDTGYKTPALITNIAEGSHSYILRLASYYDYTGSVDVIAGQTSTVNVTLQIMPGNVNFITTPPGAKIFIDNSDTGQISPYTITGLTVGSHIYKLTLANYYDYTGTVSIVANQTTTVDVILTPITGNISFITTPPGAEILLDGVSTGYITPYIIGIIQGDYDYTLRLADYYYYTGTVSVIENQTTTVDVILIPMARITINSIPSGANIFLDNIDTTKITSDTLTIVGMGDHRIKLTYPGYIDRIVSFTAYPGTLSINVILDPISLLSSTPYWPKFHNDLKNTGSIATTISSTNGNLKWTYSTGGQWIQMPPAIGPDGIIYVIVNLTYPDFALFAINPDGNLKWSSSFSGGSIYCSPTVDKDGTIYFGATDNNLYAINPDGTLKWKYNISGYMSYSTVIGIDSTIYAGSSDGNLYAINPDGTFKWVYTTSTGIYSAPIIGSDGTIYVTNNAGLLYAINPNGTFKWSYVDINIPPDDYPWIYTCPAIADDGTIYFGNGYDDSISGNSYGNIYAINPDGTAKWPIPYQTGQYIDSSPAIGSDGTIYIGSDDGNLYALNTDGTLKWSYTLGASTDSSPTIGPDGTIYISDNSGYLYAIKDNGTSGSLQWSSLTTSTNTASPVIASDGTLYIGGDDGNVYAFQSSAIISITSVPIGTRIFFDGIDTGKITPDTVSTLIEGGHKITLTYPGYLDRTISVSVSLGQILYVNAILDPISLLSSTPYWPKFHNDIKNTGSIATAISTTNGSLKWTYSTGGQWIETSPAIGPDGVIYVTVDFYPDVRLYAINPDGTLKWYSTLSMVMGVNTSPTVDKDGTIYFGTADNNLYAINPDGTLKWKYDTNAPGGMYGLIYYSSAIGSDSTIYVGNSYYDNITNIWHGDLLAINPDGTLKWRYTTSNGIWSTSTIGPDGTIYITNDDGNLFALTDSGDHAILKWIYSTGSWAEMCPGIANDGTIYITNGNGDIYAIIDSEDYATFKWIYSTGPGQYTYSSPAISSDGTIYVGSSDGNLYALNIDGTLKWSYTLGASTDSSPTIGPDGTIYISDNSGYLYAIKDNGSSGSLQWSSIITSTFLASPVIASDGTLYIGGDDGNVYAFQSQALSLSGCPTSPKYSGDTVTLNATPIQGVAPYMIQFRKSPDQSMGNDASAATEIIPDSRITGGNNVSGVPEGSTITRIYTLENTDLEGATTKSGDTGPSIIFAAEIIDSCSPSQSCTKYCKVFVGCTTPVCDFTVT